MPDGLFSVVGLHVMLASARCQGSRYHLSLRVSSALDDPVAVVHTELARHARRGILHDVSSVEPLDGDPRGAQLIARRNSFVVATMSPW